MPEPQWTWRIEHVIPSKTGAGQRVMRDVMDELRRQAWQPHDIFSIQLAMEEALINAIKHGNRLDASKRVLVRCALSPALLRVEIADEGQGFDPAAIPDPTDAAHLESPCGRGIMLMRNFMSRVEYVDSGRRVILERDRTPP